MLTDDSPMPYGIKYYYYPLKRVPSSYLEFIRPNMVYNMTNKPLMEYIDNRLKKEKENGKS